MIKHIFTLIWHRKKQNKLIIVELFFTFIILFCLTSACTYFYRLYNIPLGFNVENTLSVEFSNREQWQPADEEVLQQLLQSLAQLPQVKAAHTLNFEHFNTSSSTSERDMNNQSVQVTDNSSNDGALEALGVKLVEGRWYGEQDQGQSWQAVVINKKLRDDIYADSEVIGSLIPAVGLAVEAGEPDYRIVGVFEEFRQFGTFTAVSHYMFTRKVDNFFSPPKIILVMEEGVSNQYEEELMRTLQGVAGNWYFNIRPWTALQTSQNRLYTTGILLAGVLVLSLMVMVGFGLLGVLWQNIIRRTPEMGLRRAMGASAKSVRSQIVLELLAIATFALFLGFLVVVQLPLTGIIEAMDWALFFPSVIITTLILLSLCVVFALYPSFQATRKEPVEALRYE